MTTNFPTPLRLASYNAAGLTDAKIEHCHLLLTSHSIDILVVQETLWTERTLVTQYTSLFHHLPFHCRRTNDNTRDRKSHRRPHGLAVFLGERLMPFKAQIKVHHEDRVSRSSFTIRVGSVLVTNVYFPPSFKKDKWTTAMHAIPDSQLNQTASSGIHILLGDWNVRLGELTGDTRINHRASDFVEIVRSRCFAIVPFKSSTATFSNSRHQSSTPDFVLVSSDHLNKCSAVTVLEQSKGDSDHSPIVFDLDCSGAVDEVLPAQSQQRIATHLLEKSDRVRGAYSGMADALLKSLLVEYQAKWVLMSTNPRQRVDAVQGLLDELASSCLSVLIASAEKHCRPNKESPNLPRSITKDDRVLADLQEQKTRLLRQLKTSTSEEELRALTRRRLNQVKRVIMKHRKDLKRNRQIRYYDSLEAKSLGEQQRMIRFAKNRNQRLGAKMLRPEKLPEYSKYFSSMFNFRDGFVYGQAVGAATMREKVRLLSEEEYQDISMYFAPAIIDRFVARARSGKAAGCSGVGAELVKPVISAVAPVLSLIAEIMFRTGLCPESFQKSNIIPVPKKTNSDNIKDFRPISLTEFPRRLIEKCLALLLTPFEHRLSPMQGGFRQRRSTLDQVAVLQQIVSSRYELKKPTVITFLDIKAAYDSVDRQLLWACCKEAGISDHVIRMLSGMFDHNTSRVMIDGHEGAWFSNHVGLMQGSSLSPLLYAIFIDSLPKLLLSKFPAVPPGNTSVNSILFADDIALVAESADTMQQMLDCCTQFARNMHFHWGTQKCEVLLSRVPTLSKPLVLQNECLKVCTSFKYLGVFFNERGVDTGACVKKLGDSIGRAATALSIIGLDPFNYPLHIIANHFRSFVRSCGEYSLAILPLNDLHIAELERCQYNAIKSLLKTRARVSRLGLLTCLGLETMRLRYNVLSARWLHSVMHRKGPEFPVKQAWIDFTRNSSLQSSSFFYSHQDQSIDKVL